MARFYVNSCQIQREQNIITLEGNDSVHFGNVLRAKKGDSCEIISSDGCCFKASVLDFVNGNIILNIDGIIDKDYEPLVKSTLYQCVPKGEKTELILQKSVELGVNRIVPVLSQRSVVKITNQADAEKKAVRWNKITEEASKQCGRGVVPSVDVPTTLKKISFDDNTLKIVAYENETERSIKNVLTNPQYSQQAIENGISFFVGPEGGIAPDEYDYLLSKGFISVTLGKRILRTETAPLMVLSSLRFYFED